jgi:hypothetical protein
MVFGGQIYAKSAKLTGDMEHLKAEVKNSQEAGNPFPIQLWQLVELERKSDVHTAEKTLRTAITFAEKYLEFGDLRQIAQPLIQANYDLDLIRK